MEAHIHFSTPATNWGLVVVNWETECFWAMFVIIYFKLLINLFILDLMLEMHFLFTYS